MTHLAPAVRYLPVLQDLGGEEKPISASQLDTFKLCMRKWGWNSLDGIKGESNEAAAFGSAVHEHLERYFRDGIPIPQVSSTGFADEAGQLALAMAAASGLRLGDVAPNEVEGWFYLKAFGHTFHGKKDIGFGNNTLDWKTTSNFKWSKSEEVLKYEDIQSVLYAVSSMVESGSDFANNRWVYGERKSRKTKKVDVVITKADVLPALAEIKQLSDQIRSIRRAKLTAAQLPYNDAACGAFGGCPYIPLCNLPPESEIGAQMTQDFESRSRAFQQEMQQRQAQQGGNGMMMNPPPMNGSQMQFTPPQGGFTPPQQQQQGGFAPPPGQGQQQQQQGGFAPPPGQGQPMQQQQQGGFAPPPGNQQAFQSQGAPQFTPSQQPQHQGAFQPPPGQGQPQQFTQQGNPAVPGWEQQPQGNFQAPQQQQPQGNFQAPQQQQPQGNFQPPPGQGQAPQGAPPAAEAPKRKRRTKAEMQAAAQATMNQNAQAGEEDSEAAGYELIAEGYAMIARAKAVKGL